jgi:hypothetical protein
MALVITFPLALTAEWRQIVRRKKHGAANVRRRMWQLRSLIIQAKCGSFAATDRFIAVLAQ